MSLDAALRLLDADPRRPPLSTAECDIIRARLASPRGCYDAIMKVRQARAHLLTESGFRETGPSEHAGDMISALLSHLATLEAACPPR